LPSSQAKITYAKCIGPFCTDLNTGKNYGVILRKFGEKNVFAQKYDEIRRLDGTALSAGAFTTISSAIVDIVKVGGLAPLTLTSLG
jgi:hypothetical protein